MEMEPSSSPSSTALIHSSTRPSLEIPSTSSEIQLAISNSPNSNFLLSNFLPKHSPANHSNSNHSSINSNLALPSNNSSISRISGTIRLSSRTFKLQDSQRVLSLLSSNSPPSPGNNPSQASLSSSKYSLLNNPNQTDSTPAFPHQVCDRLPIMSPQSPLSLLLIDFDPVRPQTTHFGSNPLKPPNLVKTVPTVPFSHPDCRWNRQHSQTHTQSEFLQHSH